MIPGGDLIKTARLRASLSQRGLAERLQLPQSSIARWESGARRPSLESVIEAVRACGLDLSCSLTALDQSNDGFIWQLLDAPPQERLRHQVAAAHGIRRLSKRPASGSGEFAPVPVLRGLGKSEVRYVLVGRLAANLRGSPAVPLEAEVAVCPAGDLENRVALEAALRTLGGRRLSEAAGKRLDPPAARRPHPRAERWRVPELGATVALALQPPGTTGYGDLIRAATSEDVGAGMPVAVASLLDLIRIADASVDLADRLDSPLLERAYELNTGYVPRDQRPVVVPEGLEALYERHGIVGT